VLGTSSPSPRHLTHPFVCHLDDAPSPLSMLRTEALFPTLLLVMQVFWSLRFVTLAWLQRPKSPLPALPPPCRLRQRHSLYHIWVNLPSTQHCFHYVTSLLKLSDTQLNNSRRLLRPLWSDSILPVQTCFPLLKSHRSICHVLQVGFAFCLNFHITN